MNISLRPLLPLLGVMALAGCNAPRAPEPPEVATQGIPPAIKVAASEQHHTVYVLADKGIVPQQEKLALAGFLADVGAGGTAGTHVVVRGALPPAKLAPIARAVAAAGVDPSKIEVETGHGAGTDVAIDTRPASGRRGRGVELQRRLSELPAPLHDGNRGIGQSAEQQQLWLRVDDQPGSHDRRSPGSGARRGRRRDGCPHHQRCDQASAAAEDRPT